MNPLLRPLAVCVLLLGSLATGCKKGETPVERGNREQVLELGNLTEPTDLDPHAINTTQDFNIVSWLLEGLTRLDARDLHPVPGAAERWDVSADGTVYTFHLRANGKWSDGSPVKASEFVYSFQRILSPAFGSEYKDLLFAVQGAEEFYNGKITDFGQVGFKTPDDLTLEISLKYPVAYFPSLVAHHSWFPVHPATIEKFGKMTERSTRWTRPENYVGNGPFVLKTWKTNQFISLQKSPTYWDAEHIRLHGVNFYPIESSDTEERAFRAGQLHITSTMPNGKIDVYRREHPEFLHTDPYLGTYYYRLNVTKPPLNDPRVRRALAMSIDRRAIVETITRGGQQPAFTLLPPGITSGYEPPRRIAEDVPAAQKLLAEAGFPDGKGFPAAEILFNTNESHRAIAEAIQAMWRKNLHIDVTLKNEEAKVMQSTTRELNYQISRYAWIGDYLDPSTFMTLCKSGDGNNQTGWANPDYDRLLAQAARTVDAAERLKIYGRAEGILVDEVPIIPIYYYTRVNLRRPDVQGWYSNLLDIHDPRGVYLNR